MKVEARVLDVQSNMGGEKVGMTIDESALAHIMSVLTDLYSDPEMAVIREYATNAFDAHVEAGITRPIEVTLPTPMAPFFRIRDYGEGMNADDIRDIYSRYGTSTKRNSNDVVGMLGLGCKSALTYTDQFTLSGIKAGVVTQVSISRDEDGSGSMTIVHQDFTDQESGVEIIVPAKKVNAFEKKANDFFRFWDEGTVVVNGKAPKRVGGLWVSDDILLTDEVDQSYIVMGNVPYRRIDTAYNYGIKSVCFVPIGTVQFTPSREDLQMTSKTKHALAELTTRIAKERDASIDRQIVSALTGPDAIRALDYGKKVGYKGDPRWDKTDIPLSVNCAENTVNADGTPGVQYQFVTYNTNDNYGQKNGRTEWQVNVRQAVVDGAFWLKGFTDKSWSKTKTQKLQQWAMTTSISLPRYVICCEGLPVDTKWLDPSCIIEWADIEAQKLPSKAKGVRDDGRPTGSYSGFVDDVWERVIVAGDIDTTKPVYWFHGSVSYGRKPHGHGVLNTTACTIVALPGNRIEKFCRDFPMAISVNEGVNKVIQDWLKGITKEQLEALTVRNWPQHRTLAKLDKTLIKDYDLKGYIAAAQVNVGALMNKWAEYSRFAAMPTLKDSTSITKTYPLAFAGYHNTDGANPDHITLYVNAVYAATQNGGTV